MSNLKTITTGYVPPRRKMRFWNDTVSNLVFGRTFAEAVDAGSFSGIVRKQDLHCFRLVEITGSASVVRRLPQPDRNSHCAVQLSLSGDILYRVNGRPQLIAPGDFMIYDLSSGAEMELPAPVRLLSMCVPREQVLRCIACPEAVNSIVIRGQSGPAALVSRFLRDFWTNIETGLDAEPAIRFAHIALNLVASAYAVIPEARATQAGLLVQRRVRIRSYIEEHLADPELTPMRTAHALDMSPSHLHRLFNRAAESVAQYIRRRRLEECHRAFCNPLHRSRSVSSVALQHGFNSLSHFSRSFRARYGATPREVQRPSDLR